MKTSVVLALLATLSVGFTARELLQQRVDDLLRQSGIERAEARDHIWYSFSGGYLSYPSASTLKKIAVGDRAAIVRALGEFAQQETQSQSFLARYREFREAQKPNAPEPPKSASQLRQEMKEEHRQNILKFEQEMAKMTADQREMMKEVLASMREMGKTLDAPDNPMFSPDMDQLNRQMHAEALERYRQELAEWEQEYPASPKGMIKSWLERFLDVSKDVDFNAELVPGEGGKMIFANSAYEQQSPAWKMCFRAGKETVQAARAVAAEWLKRL
jgi:hypothetical protein